MIEKIKNVLLMQVGDHRQCPKCGETFIPNDFTSARAHRLYVQLTLLTEEERRRTMSEEQAPYGGIDQGIRRVQRELGKEPMEKLYIGCKIIRAIPMDENTFLSDVKLQVIRTDRETRPGYLVRYPDGYQSWSPKETFEEAYREVSQKEKGLF